MIAYHDALRVISDLIQPRSLDVETVSLGSAVGRVCADDIQARVDNPPFHNTAMDGFAVRLSDFKAARFPEPFMLPLSGIVAAGQGVEGLDFERGCWQVMTGAAIPFDTDSVVPIEDVQVTADRVIFASLPKAGAHIRRAGEDFKFGSPLVQRGQYLTPLHILPLATAGVPALRVYKKPKILFLSTGDEVIDDPAMALGPGQIYNSNGPFAQSYLQALGAEVHAIHALRDDPNMFTKTLTDAQAHGFDLIVSSGAVSAGTYDFVNEALKAIGANILYHKVRIKPGKPNLLAHLPSGIPYFGLPGNPVATAVGLRFFVREALRVLQRQPPEKPLFAHCMTSLSKKSGLHLILKCVLNHTENGQVSFEILDGQESFKTRPFLTMNAWAHIPEDYSEIVQNDLFEVYPAI